MVSAHDPVITVSGDYIPGFKKNVFPKLHYFLPPASSRYFSTEDGETTSTVFLHMDLLDIRCPASFLLLLVLSLWCDTFLSGDIYIIVCRKKLCWETVNVVMSWWQTDLFSLKLWREIYTVFTPLSAINRSVFCELPVDYEALCFLCFFQLQKLTFSPPYWLIC